MSTQAVIEPILTATYGKGPMVESCAKDLADIIDGWAGSEEGRERMVMLRCWDWFFGGDTAASVARKIEDALAVATPMHWLQPLQNEGER